MSYQRTFLFCLLALLALNGCFHQSKQPVTQGNTEVLQSGEIEVSLNPVLPQISDHFLGFVTPDAIELFNTTLESHLRMIDNDFQKKENLYELWQNDKDAVSLHFSWKECDYNLKETIELVCNTLQKIENPLFISNFFASMYINPDLPFYRNDLTFHVFFTLGYCVSININIGGEYESVSIIKLWNSLSDKICAYDFMSYSRYCAIKDHMVHYIEKIEPEQFLSTNLQQIIDILREVSANLDTALDFYLFSERAIVANVASSILTNKEEYEEAKKTIRYLDAIIKKRIFLKKQEMYTEEEWWLGPDIPQTEPSEIEDNANTLLANLIATRLYVPGSIMSNERYKARIEALINKFSAVLQEAP